MYLVTYRNILGTFNIAQHETLEDAKDCAIELFEKGYRDIKIAQEIPMKVKIEF